MSSIGPLSGDPMVGLAVLMLENADRLGDLEQQRLDEARRALERAAAAEVEALHDAADDVAMGAFVEGGLTIVSGVLSAGAALGGAGATQKVNGEVVPLSPTADNVHGITTTLDRLVRPMSTLAGEVPRRHDDAEATRARHQSENASMDVEDARSRGEREERQANAVLDRVGQILDTESQGNLAILGNF